MPTRNPSCLLAVLLLAGCATVGPDYHVPADAAAGRPAAQASFTEARQGPYGQQALPPHWWRLYDDPSLDRLIQDALQANTDLRQAAANLARAQAGVQAAQGAGRPGVSVQAQPSLGHESGIQAGQPGQQPADRAHYSGGVSVSYQVDLFGQIRRAVEAAQGDAQAAQAAYDAARVTVAAETARAYADLCAAGMQWASARQSVQWQQASLKAVRQLQRAGRGTALDVERAQTQLQQLQAALPPFEAQRRTAFYRLAALTGRAPAELPPALLQCAQPPRLTQTIPVGDGAALLRRRPDIRQAERELAAASARIGVATGDLYPRITLGLSAASAGPASMLGQSGTLAWSLGPLIHWTLPNTGIAQARIAQAEAASQQAAAHFDGVVLNALRETESALVTYARQLDRHQALLAAQTHSAQAARQARELFRLGKSDYLGVLDAERTQAETASALAASQASLARDQIALFLALGGGWQADTPAP
ncbi:outer membrane multidrug efflux protein [Bordetella trematum]|uniref:efflux transporter outer membrane subunit n=1 Tax=Bordetella trematum TaxID=123899 RepID=UPI0007928BF1|nr:TolC family protein [Bordetella trematum]QIM72879.1 TolC family protein [Bordetella trematum]SAI51911.1 outer membrane multidrug efflux protein [Bordetella trematum]